MTLDVCVDEWWTNCVADAPQFTITPRLLTLVEQIAAVRERIQGASVELAWVPALQQESRSRNTHASTSIEGNPLTLKQVQALDAGRELARANGRAEREVTNYLAGLKYIEARSDIEAVRHDDLFALHRILAEGVMDQGDSGQYRTIFVTIGGDTPPGPHEVSPLMFELLDWWNKGSRELSPILSSAILHYRFEAIHPFADGNGRTGRALALWELYRRGFDTHHIFSVDEYYWQDRPAYYDALRATRQSGDLTGWLEYCAEGLRQTLESVWLRVQSLQPVSGEKLVLSSKQQALLRLLVDHGGMGPSEIRELMGMSKQGVMNLMNPLLDAGIVTKVGNHKTGRYQLTSR